MSLPGLAECESPADLHRERARTGCLDQVLASSGSNSGRRAAAASTRIPSAGALPKFAIVAIRVRSVTSLGRGVDRLVGPHGVEGDVDALRCELADAADQTGAVGHRLAAERADLVVTLRPGRCRSRGHPGRGRLHDERTNRARHAMNQDGVPLLDPRGREQVDRRPGR